MRPHLLVWVAVIIAVTVVRDVVFRWTGAGQEVLLADMEMEALLWAPLLATATSAVVPVGYIAAFFPAAPRWALPVAIGAFCVLAVGFLGVTGRFGLPDEPVWFGYVWIACLPLGYLILLVAALAVAIRVNGQVGWGVGVLVPADLVLGWLLMFGPAITLEAAEFRDGPWVVPALAGIACLTAHVLIVAGALRASRAAAGE
ncbi:hypothetical protein GCM10009751_34020 [Myceligenerans crystallogenes]|uniref:MYXO-CTERM domain-containing protein n=1 Tax=Myceligenerans crystallogenes TaxID=316335 RepID=A0ABN2NJN9_9MICO